MIKRTLIFVVLLTLIWTVEAAYDVGVQPEVGTELTIKSVNGTNADATLVRANQRGHNTIPLIGAGLTLASFIACFGTPIKRKVISMRKEESVHA